MAFEGGVAGRVSVEDSVAGSGAGDEGGFGVPADEDDGEAAAESEHRFFDSS